MQRHRSIRFRIGYTTCLFGMRRRWGAPRKLKRGTIKLAIKVSLEHHVRGSERRECARRLIIPVSLSGASACLYTLIVSLEVVRCVHRTRQLSRISEKIEVLGTIHALRCVGTLVTHNTGRSNLRDFAFCCSAKQAIRNRACKSVASDHPFSRCRDGLH